MTYIEGFVTAVPTANKDAYLAHARRACALLKPLGVARIVEAWGDDVPRGKTTDFYGAVQAAEDETVLFSWFEYPDKAARDAATARIIAEPRMADMMKDMPFDAGRMIYGGFAAIVERGEAAGGYVDGFVAPVRPENKDAYRAMAERAAAVFAEHGAVRVLEGWGDDVPTGERTDYRRAVKAEDDENVVFSFIAWPDKATRDAAWPRVMEDERMTPSSDMPFDGRRMFWGGFQTLIDN